MADLEINQEELDTIKRLGLYNEDQNLPEYNQTLEVLLRLNGEVKATDEALEVINESEQINTKKWFGYAALGFIGSTVLGAFHLSLGYIATFLLAFFAFAISLGLLWVAFGEWSEQKEAVKVKSQIKDTLNALHSDLNVVNRIMGTYTFRLNPDYQKEAAQ